MADKFPLSGDVTQTINPWTWWLKNISTQTGFVNINNINSGDPELEKDILENVASYGRQLGRMGQVMEVLLEHLPADSLTDDQASAISEYRTMQNQINARKAGRNSATLGQQLESVLQELDRLKQSDADQYQALRSRVQTWLETAGNKQRHTE